MQRRRFVVVDETARVLVRVVEQVLDPLALGQQFSRSGSIQAATSVLPRDVP
jgi:hypothetical protein